MTDKPIIFSAPMIRALLDGRKTQTRRVLKPQPRPLPEGMLCKWHVPGKHVGFNLTDEQMHRIGHHFVPYDPGDRLWVREHWRTARAYDDLTPSALSGEEPVKYEADGTEQMWGWPHLFLPGRFRQGGHMPRWASRLTLIVTDVRVQRVQEISEADAKAEGVTPVWPDGVPIRHDGTGAVCIEAFRNIWNSIHGPCAWDANPWVAAISFTVERRNIDEAKP